MLDRRVALGCLLWLQTGWAAGVPRNECFPLERLPPDLRARSDAILLDALDHEFLYTIIGGLKPWTAAPTEVEGLKQIAVTEPARIEQTQRILATWRCAEEIHADVAPAFRQEIKGMLRVTPLAHPYVVHVSRMRAVIRRHAALYAKSGITPLTPPAAVFATVTVFSSGVDEQAASDWRMAGFLFGYPEHAVEAFVTSVLTTRRRDESAGLRGPLIQVPVFDPRSRTGYSYNVAKGHRENEADRAILRQAAAILAEYKTRRARYIGPGKPGVVTMLRDWFDDGKGNCAPTNARIAPR
ncbi:MAG: hypothetical protein HY235_14405 [Acidobacteria bacterium]|nr:hypothetical protein [Acidobacteriota bacterium]